MNGFLFMSTTGSPGAPTSRTTVKRIPDRARYDRNTVNLVLDEALICHVGFVADGSAFVIPTIHARVGDVLYFHGSPASRMLRQMKKGVEVTVTATIVDGIIAARSAFHHSMRYRSAMVFGEARVVEDPEERAAAFEAITNAVLPGRWSEARVPNRKEDKGTLLVSVPIEEYSAKVNDGNVGDEPEDYDLPIWAGVIPLSIVPGSPIPDDGLPQDMELPESVERFIHADTAESR
jgi:nitroimidazol reductase NimA-like FMN-containing flavoprotein (pyridoxamine 5'-phosphate oxidase superfamily)